jgi:hypothetical protein
MGRKSKLSADQWAEALRRVAEGEAQRAVARSLGISESALRERVSAQAAQVKNVAHQIVATERALQALPVTAQITAHNLAAKLRSISDNLASAAELGAKTAHRLHALANSEVAKVDDAEPLKSLDSLRNVGVLTKLANESAHVALNLMAANKDTVKRLNDDEKPDAPAIDPSVLSDGALEELMSARAPR